MALPLLDDILTPLLKVTKENKEYTTERGIRFIGKYFNLTEEEKDIIFIIEGEEVKVLRELVGIARDLLRGVGFIKGVAKSFSITTYGRKIVTSKLAINHALLQTYPAYKEFFTKNQQEINNYWPILEKSVKEYNKGLKIIKKDTQFVKNVVKESNSSFEKEILNEFDDLKEKLNKYNLKLVSEIHNKLFNVSSEMFEKIALEVAFNEVYEGIKESSRPSMAEVTKVTKHGADDGIDGFVTKKGKRKDEIWLVQAKRYSRDNTISNKLLKEFVGTLISQKTTNGIFITTSKFTKAAEIYAESDEIKNRFTLIKIDGEELVENMINFEIGVQIKEEHKFKVVDEDYFKTKKKK